MKQDVLGLQFDNVTMDEAVARAEELLEAPGASIVVTPNAEIGYEALHDAQFRALLNGADLVLPDGAGVVLAAKLRKTPLKQMSFSCPPAQSQQISKTIGFLSKRSLRGNWRRS